MPGTIELNIRPDPFPGEQPEDRMFYEAIGRVNNLWARFENDLTLKTVFACSFEKIAIEPDPVRNEFKGKIELFRRCFAQMPSLKPLEERANNLTKAAKTIAEQRNMVAHGAFMGLSSRTPLAAIMRKVHVREGGPKLDEENITLKWIHDLQVEINNLSAHLTAISWKMSSIHQQLQDAAEEASRG